MGQCLGVVRNNVIECMHLPKLETEKKILVSYDYFYYLHHNLEERGEWRSLQVHSFGDNHLWPSDKFMGEGGKERRKN